MDWSSLLALAGQASDAGATAAPKSGGGLSMLPLLIGMVALFYFMIIRPQKKSQQQVDEMRNTVKKGDRVKSIGGIYGTVTAVDTTNGIVTVQVDRNVKLDFDKNAIATVIKKEDAKQLKESPAASEQEKPLMEAEPPAGK